MGKLNGSGNRNRPAVGNAGDHSLTLGRISNSYSKDRWDRDVLDGSERHSCTEVNLRLNESQRIFD
jgi:hypothetical protein